MRQSTADRMKEIMEKMNRNNEAAQKMILENKAKAVSNNEALKSSIKNSLDKANNEFLKNMR